MLPVHLLHSSAEEADSTFVLTFKSFYRLEKSQILPLSQGFKDKTSVHKSLMFYIFIATLLLSG